MTTPTELGPYRYREPGGDWEIRCLLKGHDGRIAAVPVRGDSVSIDDLLNAPPASSLTGEWGEKLDITQFG
jgi:hypothetical protein